MRKLAPFWWWIFGSVIVGVAGNIYADDIGAWLKIKPANLAIAVGEAVAACDALIERESNASESALRELVAANAVGLKAAALDVMSWPTSDDSSP